MKTNHGWIVPECPVVNGFGLPRLRFGDLIHQRASRYSTACWAFIFIGMTTDKDAWDALNWRRPSGPLSGDETPIALVFGNPFLGDEPKFWRLTSELSPEEFHFG